MKRNQFMRRTLGLFFIVSSVPAMIVGATWYASSQSVTYQSIAGFIFPVMMIGLLPAIGLSFLFAEVLYRPIRRIHREALSLAGGHYGNRDEIQPGSEFAEISQALTQASQRLEEAFSEMRGEMGLVEAERNKLRSVMNTMSDGVFALDQAGRIMLFNHAASQLTGRSIESVAGQLAEKVMPFRRDGELVMTRWLDSQLGTDHKRGQWKGLELYRADGTSLYVDVQATTLNDDPNGIRALITFHDLTEEHHLEEMKVDFVALAAHELRTPITEVRGYLDIMTHEPMGLRPAARELINRCVVSVTQLSGLVNNLLGVARIEHGEVNYHPVMTDWKVFLASLQPELTEQAKQQKRHFSLKVTGRLPRVMIDPVAMQEVIMNLFNNAMAHTDAGRGTIELSVRLHDHEIETSLKDNGSGIPAEALSRLFTKFYHYEGLKTTRGTGLGLYISKSIVENHGGYIWADSTVGEGATFSFRLPTKTRLAGQRPARDNAITVTQGTHGWIKDHTIH